MAGTVRIFFQGTGPGFFDVSSASGSVGETYFQEYVSIIVVHAVNQFEGHSFLSAVSLVLVTNPQILHFSVAL